MCLVRRGQQGGRGLLLAVLHVVRSRSFGPDRAAYACGTDRPGADRPGDPRPPSAGAPIAAPIRGLTVGGTGKIILGVVVALIAAGVIQHMLIPTYHVPD